VQTETNKQYQIIVVATDEATLDVVDQRLHAHPQLLMAFTDIAHAPWQQTMRVHRLSYKQKKTAARAYLFVVEWN
jgi:hypothetical protein